MLDCAKGPMWCRVSAMDAGSSPREVYEARLGERRRRLASAERRDRRLSAARLVVFLLAAGLGLLALLVEGMSLLWLAAPAAVFIVLVGFHAVTVGAMERTRLAVAHYEQCLRRIDDRWHGAGCTGEGFADDAHPYAVDLDLLGRGSLFELLCTARTRAGEETLAAWLLDRCESDVLRERHDAVREMMPQVDMREELSLLAGGLRSSVHPAMLSRWAESPPAFSSRWRGAVSLLAWALTIGAAATAALWALSVTGPLPFLAVALVEWCVLRALRSRVNRAVSAVTMPSRELLVLAGVLERLAREPYRTARPCALQARLRPDREPASRSIERLHRLVSWLDFQNNALFAPIAMLLMWRLHFALLIDAWRTGAGRHIAGWLDVVGEFEALQSLACYGYEHPADPFPELVDEGPLFDGEGLGHPLMPDRTCVRNSVRLDGKTPVLIVSGSNMSGKSTLLRTVGINAVLAQAGAPVRARRLRLSPRSIGATIRIQDSIHDGRSRFYAEIQRLKKLMDMTAGPAPVLLLLDEILHGTNSSDRLEGASALLRRFIDAGAIGLVTTHDLAIAGIEESMGGRVRNVHFDDAIVGGAMTFDYKLRDGIVQGSNAIALMRGVGLPL